MLTIARSQDMDIVGDRITISQHGLREGTPLEYRAPVAPGLPIAALVDGNTYFAKAVTIDSFQLADVKDEKEIDLTRFGVGSFAYVPTGRIWFRE